MHTMVQMVTKTSPLRLIIGLERVEIHHYARDEQKPNV